MAKICRHRGDLLPPPQILLVGMAIPRDFATSTESRMAKATPSSTAWSKSPRVVSMVMPTKVPRALVSLMGLRSPMR